MTASTRNVACSATLVASVGRAVCVQGNSATADQSLDMLMHENPRTVVVFNPRANFNLVPQLQVFPHQAQTNLWICGGGADIRQCHHVQHLLSMQSFDCCGMIEQKIHYSIC